MEGIAPILHVADARASSEWYAQLGFVVESEHALALSFHLGLGPVQRA